MRFQRLGNSKPFNVDVRIITATNRNLEEFIRDGKFRDDLYYRFNVVTLQLPPLRYRRTDIPLLVNHFIEKYSEINNKSVSNISHEALDALMRYDYPGNIRELENIIQRAVVLTRDSIITLADLPAIVREPLYYESKPCVVDEMELGDLNEIIDSIETNLISKALVKNTGQSDESS